MKDIKLRRRSLLLHSSVKLDVMFPNYQSEILERFKGFRMYMSDASKKGNVNLLAHRLVAYLFPRNFTMEDIMDADWAKYYTTRYLMLSTLGYGAGDTLQRSRNFAVKQLLEAGSTAGFEQLREESCGWTSDQGTDPNVMHADD